MNDCYRIAPGRIELGGKVRMLVMNLQMGTGTKLGFQGVNLQKLSFSGGGGMGLESETGETCVKLFFKSRGLVLFSAMLW